MQIEINMLEDSILILQNKMNLPRYRELNNSAVKYIDQNCCDANSSEKHTDKHSVGHDDSVKNCNLIKNIDRNVIGYGDSVRKNKEHVIGCNDSIKKDNEYVVACNDSIKKNNKCLIGCNGQIQKNNEHLELSETFMTLKNDMEYKCVAINQLIALRRGQMTEINEKLEVLDPIDRTVISLYYIDCIKKNGKARTWNDVANDISYSLRRTQDIHKRALKKLSVI